MNLPNITPTKRPRGEATRTMGQLSRELDMSADTLRSTLRRKGIYAPYKDREAILRILADHGIAKAATLLGRAPGASSSRANRGNGIPPPPMDLLWLTQAVDLIVDNFHATQGRRHSRVELLTMLAELDAKETVA